MLLAWQWPLRATGRPRRACLWLEDKLALLRLALLLLALLLLALLPLALLLRLLGAAGGDPRQQVGPRLPHTHPQST